VKLREAIFKSVPFDEVEKHVDYIQERVAGKGYKKMLQHIVAISNGASNVVKDMTMKRICLVRGTDAKGSPVFSHSKRTTERKPVDSRRDIDEYVEQFRAKNYGSIPSRRKSVYCFLTNWTLGNSKAGMNEYARSYGRNIYVVFPLNGSKYFQSLKVPDFLNSWPYSMVEEYLEFKSRGVFLSGNEPDLTGNKESAFSKVKKSKDRADEELDKYFTNSNNKFAQMSKKNHEIVIEHKGYIALNTFDLNVYAELYKGGVDVFHGDHIAFLKKRII